MWVNNLELVPKDSEQEAYVMSLVRDDSPMMETGGIRITFIMDRHADSFVIVEFTGHEFSRFSPDVYSFESTQQALIQWTEIVADYTNQNLFDAVRKAFK